MQAIAIATPALARARTRTDARTHTHARTHAHTHTHTHTHAHTYTHARTHAHTRIRRAIPVIALPHRPSQLRLRVRLRKGPVRDPPSNIIYTYIHTYIYMSQKERERERERERELVGGAAPRSQR